MLKNRSTTDIVVLLFTALVAAVIILIVLGAVIGRIIHPEMDVSKAAEIVMQNISTIIGALVGFISGRVYGRRELEKEQNGLKQ